MTAKDFLDRAYKLDQHIDYLLQQTESLRSQSERGAEDNDAASHSHDHTAAQDVDVRLKKIEEALCSDIDKMIVQRREISDVISEVRDSRYRLILEKRYLAFLSWDKIAADLNIGRPWVLAQHRRALVAVEKLLVKKGLIQEKAECT